MGRPAAIVRCALSSGAGAALRLQYDVLRIGIPEFGLSITIDLAAGGTGFTSERDLLPQAPGTIHVEVDGGSYAPGIAYVPTMDPLQRGVYAAP